MGSCTNLCTAERVKKPPSGVPILHDKWPTSFPDSVWNSCNWQSKISKVGFKPLVMNHFPLKSLMLKVLTRTAGSGTRNSPTSDFLGTHFFRDTAHSLNSSTTLFSNKSPHFICKTRIKRINKTRVYLDWYKLIKPMRVPRERYRTNLTFNLIWSIVASLETSNIGST